jgi:hypothetical protein
MTHLNLRELSDIELLDLLDVVSDEVKRRNSLYSASSADEASALRNATDVFGRMLKSVMNR